MKIAVFGLGYVGCVSAACLARSGHDVIGVDVNAEKVATIAKGQAPIVEPGLADLLAEVVRDGRLHATTNCVEAVQATSVALVCVGTPSGPGGQPSVRAVERVGQEIGQALAGRTDPYAVVLRSTALPGTTDTVLLPAIRDAAGVRLPALGVAVNPEFMREGASLHDFDHPPFVLIGCDDSRTGAVVRSIYEGVKAPFVRTSVRTAELVKYASNAFHGLKVCFANEMAALADTLGADAGEVMRIFARDRKLNISDAYLRPGFAFGGSCLPKDIRGLLWAARTHDVELPLLGSVLASNHHQIDEAIARIRSLGQRRVGVVGLAFKSNTDDLRESPVVTVVEALIGKGLDVRILDSNVSMARLMGANRRYIESEIPHIASLLCSTPGELVAHADVIVIGNRSPEADAVLAGLERRHQVIDLTRSVPPQALAAAAQEAGLWA